MSKRGFIGLYWRRLREHANFWPDDVIDVAQSAVEIPLVLLLVYQAFGRDRAMEEVKTTALYLLAALGTAALFTGLRFVRAGYRVFQEDQQSIISIERAKDASDADLAALTTPRARLRHETGRKPDFMREANVAPGVKERRHLLGVENLSTGVITRLRVVAERFEPYLQGATWPDAPLHPARSRQTGEGRFDLSRGDGQPTRYVEVFQELRVEGKPTLLTLVYDSPGLVGLRRFIVADDFAVTLRLDGDIPPARIRLVAKLNRKTGWFDVFEDSTRRVSVATAQQHVVQVSGGDPMSAQEKDAAPSIEPPDDINEE